MSAARAGTPDRDTLAATLARAGFLAAEDEAAQLLDRARGDAAVLSALLSRRLTGEPLAWITGTCMFCDTAIRVDPGVYVPRWQSEALTRRAVSRLPARGVAVDVCTGSGAVAAVIAAARPRARVVGSDIDTAAVACARANGVEAYCGDLLEPLPQELRGHADVVVAVVPYVPTPELSTLQRDTFTFESALAYDGGADGTAVLRRLLRGSARFLREGGALLLELGGAQADLLAGDVAELSYVDVEVMVDEDGDVRGLEATLAEGR